MIGSTVWASLATSQAVANAIPFIDSSRLEPVIDSGASGILVNFGYTLNSAVNGAGGLHVGVFGDFTGVQSLNLGGQGDSYIPVGNQSLSTVGGLPGFSTRSSRGTRYIQSNSLEGDILGEFAGYGLLGASSPLAYTKLAGMRMYCSGASETDPGGKIRWGTKADGGVYTEWIELNKTGGFYPRLASSPLTPTLPNSTLLGKAGYGWGALYLDYNITATVGAVQINKPMGRAIIALGASSVVITNSLVTANSIIFAQLAAVDATLVSIKAVVAAAGSFTIHGNANATADTAVNFVVLGAD